MLTKTIDSEDYKYYNKFEEIPIDDLEFIWYLDCKSENMTDISFIINIPNLKELDASYNLITSLVIHDSLEIINIKNNQINILPTFISAKSINISFNRLTSIYSLPKIKKLDVSNNLLNILILEPSLIELNCSYNNINKIICNTNKIYKLEQIDCSYNNMNNINFIFILYYLNEIIYNNNIITYIAPHIKRLLSDDNLYYKKSRHSITMKEQLKIHDILLKRPINFNIAKKEILNHPYLSNSAKYQMLYYSEFDEPNYKIHITYKELLCSAWAIIRKNNNNPLFDYISNLNYIYMTPHICKCRSCQLINLSNFMDNLKTTEGYYN